METDGRRRIPSLADRSRVFRYYVPVWERYKKFFKGGVWNE